jgi:FkbM family methyltransferase
MRNPPTNNWMLFNHQPPNRIHRTIRRYAAEYYSEYGEDRWIHDNLPIPARGVFVDVGAGDGVQGSNSLFFEQRGWTGLLVEPDPRQCMVLRATRKAPMAECAIGSDDKRPFFLDASPCLSGFLRTGNNSIQVPTDSLTKVLREHRIDRIDLLSIDTEGTELEVWRTLDVPHYKPAIVIIEWLTFGIAKDPTNMQSAIENDGYRLVHRTPSNLILIRNDS